MMLNHQKGPKQNWKKNSCSQFQAPVPQTNDQLGANAPTRLLGPPSNWPYDESFALAMRAAAAVRGMTWNDGVISWMCKQFGVWDRSTQLICTFFLRWAIPFRWACWAAASPQPSSGIAAVFRMYGPMDLGETCDVQLVALELTKVKWYLGSEYAQLSSLSSWRSRRKECWVPWIYSYSTPQTLSFFMLAQDDQNLGLGPNKDPLKNRLKAVAAIGVRDPIRTHFPKTIKSGSVSNYELHIQIPIPPKGQVGHLWILSEIQMILRRWGSLLNRVKTYMKMVDLRATVHWVRLILWCLLTLIFGHVKLSSIKLYIYNLTNMSFI